MSLASPGWGRLLRRSMLEIVLGVLCVALAAKAPGFLTADNLLNVLRNVSMPGIIAFGMTMVIISGEIDLSVGSAVAFAGCLCAWLTGYLMGPPCHLPAALVVPLAMVATIGVGTLIGVGTGVLRMRFRVPTFITTLAWMTVLKGAAELVTNGFPLLTFPDWFNFFGGGYLWRVPFPAIVLVAAFLATHILMNFTTFGRAVYAVGGNTEAARLSGIRVERVKIGVMAGVAGLAALAGIMQASQIMSGASASGVGWELDVIAAVIIGGTSLMGGAGRVWGTMVGVIFLGVLVNGMTLLGISEYWQHVVKGGLILMAVLLNVAPAPKGRGAS